MMCTQTFRAWLLFGATLAAIQPATIEAAIRPVRLRCEYKVNPLGIDVTRPRLSWILQSDQRGQKQTAYHVLVASNQERLSTNHGDLWDSGKIQSDQSIHVAYAGKPPAPAQRCYWKVMVWDKDGRASAWSAPGVWSMALFDEAAWAGAQWIGAHEESTLSQRGQGWRSGPANKPNTSKWVQLDLGRPTRIDRIRLYILPQFDPVRYRNIPLWQLFRHVRVEVSRHADMRDAVGLLPDEKEHPDILNTWQSHYPFVGKGLTARYIRVTTKMGKGQWFGMREIEVESGTSNAALGAKVTASDSVETGGWGAAHLTDGLEAPDGAAVLLRKPIELKAKPVRATATISGLGYAELYLNGQKIGDRMLDPCWLDYTKRVPYTTYDVTGHLSRGANTIGVMLGNSFFNPQVPDAWALEKAPWVAAPKCRFHLKLEYADGSVRTIVSDSSWKWYTGELVFNCLRGGETVDMRRAQPGWNTPDFDVSSWRAARVVPAPGGRMVAQMHPPTRVVRSIEPKTITEVHPGVWVFDFGLNMSGWARLKASGRAGHRIVLRFGETINGDGTVNTLHCTRYIFGRYQKGELILSGRGEDVFEPRFSYSGFRYVQVEGLPAKPTRDTLIAKLVHADAPVKGHFACSNDRFNHLQQVVTHSQRVYMHHFPRDPAREKLGWTQDIQTCLSMSIFNFDSANIYRNWYTEILNTQQPSGHVKPIGPSSGWGRCFGANNHPGSCSDPWWGGAVAFTPWILYEYYGDRRPLQAGYEPMRQWVAYLGTQARDDMLYWQLGDWCEVASSPKGHHGGARRTPRVQTTTAGYYMAVDCTRRAAELLGHTEDASRYARQADRIRSKFNQKFFDSKTGLYAKDSQTSQALPLELGMAPTDKRPLVLQRLIENIHQRKGHLSTGFVGTLPLLKVLTDTGHAQIAYTIATREDWPGWLHMLNLGSTTIWEDWNGPKHPGDNVSRNCISLGGPIGWWFYYALGGIRPDPSGPGFKRIIIKPEVVGDLAWVKADYDSMHGKIVSDWKLDDDHMLTLNVTVPPNTTATVYVPTKDVKALREGDVFALRAKQVKFLRMEGDRAVFVVGSGRYRFCGPMANAN